MSVVACRVLGGGRYEIAADSITVRHTTQSKGGDVKFSKLAEVNGLVIGGVGTAEESALLYMYASSRKPVTNTEAGMLEYLGEFSAWKKQKTDDAKITNDFIIGIDGKVYLISGWFVVEVLTFQAIGAGMNYALAALHLGHDVKRAVEVATELSIYCEPPVIVIQKGNGSHDS